ncbi:MAG TPA: glycosyltransferase family 4 protein [Candidatus Acidoferrum sp.]|nr:glycosyltransferase family 4 protein [Candidatus Acidoferrum sp.]
MKTLSVLQIGLIASATQTSGSDRYYFSLLRELAPLGVDVRGVVLGDPAAVEEPVPGVASFAPEGSRMVRRWLGLRRTVRPLLRGRNLVVSHWAAHAFPVLDQIRSRPLVVHFHNPWSLEGKAAGIDARRLALRWVQERAVYGSAARFIVLSRANREVLERTYGVPREKIRIVPGAADLRRFSATLSRREARERLGWALDRPTILVAARLVPAKGVGNLIAAIAQVRRAYPDVRLVVVGDGPLAGELRDQVRSSGLEDAVQFAGYLTDSLPLAYRAADLCVVPSVAFESFGLVAAEALACGTPVLVTPVLGLPEVVSDLEPALVLEGSAPEQLAAGIRAALGGTSPLPDDEACARYAQRFAWPTIAQRVRDVYAEVA